MISSTCRVILFSLALTSFLPTARATAAPDPQAAARALLNRVLPGHAGQFRFEKIPPDRGRDVFELEREMDGLP